MANDFYDTVLEREFVYTHPEKSWNASWWGGEPVCFLPCCEAHTSRTDGSLLPCRTDLVDRDQEWPEIRRVDVAWATQDAGWDRAYVLVCFLPFFTHEKAWTNLSTDWNCSAAQGPVPRPLSPCFQSPPNRPMARYIFSLYLSLSLLSSHLISSYPFLDLPLASRPNLILAYAPEVDQEGHRTGPDSEKVDQELVGVDEFARLVMDVVAERNLTDLVDLVFVSDHGMTG